MKMPENCTDCILCKRIKLEGKQVWACTYGGSLRTVSNPRIGIPKGCPIDDEEDRLEISERLWLNGTS